VEPLRLRYRDLAALVRDLRAGGDTNVLHARGPSFTRDVRAAATAAFAALGRADGSVVVDVQLIYCAARVSGGT